MPMKELNNKNGVEFDQFLQTNLNLLQTGKITQQQFKQIMKFANHKSEATTTTTNRGSRLIGHVPMDAI